MFAIYHLALPADGVSLFRIKGDLLSLLLTCLNCVRFLLFRVSTVFVANPFVKFINCAKTAIKACLKLEKKAGGYTKQKVQMLSMCLRENGAR